MVCGLSVCQTKGWLIMSCRENLRQTQAREHSNNVWVDEKPWRNVVMWFTEAPAMRVDRG